MSTFLKSGKEDTKSDFSSLIDVVNYRVENQPLNQAYTFLQNGENVIQEWTYEELHLRSLAIAASLQDLNLVGERALLLYQPGLDFIAAFLGCIYAGIIAVPAYPPRRNRNLSRLQAIATDAKAKIVLTSSSLLANLRSASEDESLEINGLQWLGTDELDRNSASKWCKPSVKSDDIAFLQYTSGSTGNPKGVMISHGNLLDNLRIIHECFGHTPTSQGVIWLPPYHDMGLIGGILQPIYGGFPVTLMPSVAFLQKPIRWLQVISDCKATTSGAPNFAYELCVDKVKPEQLASLDLSSWEVAFTGAEPIRSETLERFAKTFACCGFRKEAFYPCYGMAETTLIVSGGEKRELPITCKIEDIALEQNLVVKVDSLREGSREIVSCGRIPDGVSAVVVNPDLTCCSCQEVGEIWVRGDSVAKGYWNLEEETQKTFHAYLADTGEGPFLRTGDLGFLQDGELYVTGRLKDLIIIRGQNHYPQDIELTVEGSHQALRNGCGAAFTIDIKGKEELVVVQELERSYLRKLNISEVVGDIRQAVVSNHGLRLFSVVLVKTASIPKTSSGKIRRRACRDAFLSGNLDIVDDWSESPQHKAKFISVNSEVESVLQQVVQQSQIIK
ncbi:MAG: fatty acyl-AMP ligase [Rivularia sp. (in: Bacteria)]|nr:fatty acyl-AMP ligase [Rivularia sp. MS3]